MSSSLINFQTLQAQRIINRNSKADSLRITLQNLKKKGEELLAAQKLGSADVETLQSEYDDLLSQANNLRSDLIDCENTIHNDTLFFLTKSAVTRE